MFDVILLSLIIPSIQFKTMKHHLCAVCDKTKLIDCTCHECDKMACQKCAKSGAFVWIVVPWINDGKLPVSFCQNCIENFAKIAAENESLLQTIKI